MMGKGNLRATVHSSVRCIDSLLYIAGKSFLGVPSIDCLIAEDTEVEITEGPIRIEDSEGQGVDVVKVRHLNADGSVHEGWVPLSFVHVTKSRDY